MKAFLRWLLAACGAGTCLAISGTPGSPPPAQPNIIFILADDMGYGDWAGGGNPTIRTPNLDRLAREGVTLTQFYAGAAVCTPSRAVFLTGRNAIRTGLVNVLAPADQRGLPPGEITLAAQLKARGYRTASIGKWHLGGDAAYWPDRHGFDYWYGLLHSNNQYDERLWRNGKVIEDPVDQSTLTQRYTSEALAFIGQEAREPFFLYLAHTMPHVPVFVSEKFKGRSRAGIYGDAIEEIDDGVGQILDTLRRLGLDRNTLVIFTSDNGPALYKSVPRGSSGLLRGCKGDTWEGGLRVPFLAHFPGKLPAGLVCREVAAAADVFPTCLELAGVTPPDDRPYDGSSLLPLLTGGTRPEPAVYLYKGGDLVAVRQGRWKLHFQVMDYPGGNYTTGGRRYVTPAAPLLYDVEADPSEHYEVAAGHADVVARLTALARAYEEEIASRQENADLIRWFKTDYPKNERKLSPAN